MTEVSLLAAGEPPLAFPDIAFALGFFDQCHPPVEEKENCGANDPLDGEQNQVSPAKQDEPKKTVLTLYIGQLYMCAAAFGTFLVKCHVKTPLFICFIFKHII